MTEEEVQHAICNIPVGARIQLIKTSGDIVEVVLASHETSAVEEKNYDKLVVPALPPALTVQGGRWGVFRMEIDDIINIARIA